MGTVTNSLYFQFAASFGLQCTRGLPFLCQQTWETPRWKLKFLPVLKNSFEDRYTKIYDVYRIYSAISRDPKLCTCRLGITRTKTKSKTSAISRDPFIITRLNCKLRENLTFSEKNHISCHKWGLEDGDLWWFDTQRTKKLLTIQLKSNES